MSARPPRHMTARPPRLLFAEKFDMIIDVYEKSEADRYISHLKYKRCLAMAGKCRLRARWFGDNAFYKKEQWALQWHQRWLELAQKFKG